MKTMPIPLRLEVVEEGEQPPALVERQRGCRLVEDEDARVGDERLEDVEDLVLAERERLAFRPEIDVDAEPIRKAPCLGVQRAVADQETPERLAAEHDVLGRRQTRNDREMLVRDRDSGRERVRDRAEPDRCAVHDQFAHVVRDGAADDLDQRGLAGAVGADQPEHLAPMQIHVDIGERADAAETLADAAGLQQRPREIGRDRGPGHGRTHERIPDRARSRYT